MYSSGLRPASEKSISGKSRTAGILTAALTLNQNPFFEIGSSIVIEMVRIHHIVKDMQYSYDSRMLNSSGGISQLNSHPKIPISPKAQ